MTSMKTKEYLDSGWFVHDCITEYVDQFLTRAADMVRAGTKMTPLLIFWPEHPVKTDDAKVVTHTVLMEVSDSDDVKDLAKRGAKRTSAYGVLFFKHNENELHAVLETQRGSDTWSAKVQKRGDTWHVYAPTKTRGAYTLGVFDQI
jgi:hypothetical protein